MPEKPPQPQDFIDWDRFRLTDEYKELMLAAITGGIVRELYLVKKLSEEEISKIIDSIESLDQARDVCRRYSLKLDIDDLIKEQERTFPDFEKRTWVGGKKRFDKMLDEKFGIKKKKDKPN